MTFKYRIYYKYKLSKSNFMDDELSQEDIERNKELLLSDLVGHFEEVGGVVELSNDGVISINTSLSRKECDDVVAGYLSGLHLLAHKVRHER